MLRRILAILAALVVWLGLATAAFVPLLAHSSASTVVASHDAVAHPTLDGHVRLDLGPYLPDVRFPSGQRMGVLLELGKTTAPSTPVLVQRYANIAAHPQAEQARVSEVITGLVLRAAVEAAVLGSLPVWLWLLLGRRRRRELPRVLVGGSSVPGVALRLLVLAVIAAVVVVLMRPVDGADERVQAATWIPAQAAIPEVALPEELSEWQVQGGLLTTGTRRLLDSMFSTYEQSRRFYADIVDRVDSIAGDLHKPAEDETVAVLVSDRHDNVGMDAVVRAVADRGGAEVVIDAGDDTSTGGTWEGFSLDSLNRAFRKYDAHVFVAGNHDHGTFVARHLEKLGWTHLDGKAFEPFAGVRLLGVDDPRSSGLGNWRDETGLGFAGVKEKLADEVCRLDAKGERVATVVVHDAKLGQTALEQGCTDLVVGGHLHVQVGPTKVTGSDGKSGYSYTNGTTGGAAYAIALGSKLKRDAQVTLLTFRDGHPVGLQPVTIRTTGELLPAAYFPLER